MSVTHNAIKNFTLPIRFGIALSGSLIAYFLILSLFDLHTNVFFSLFNGIITGFGIYEAIRYRRIENLDRFDYRLGFITGVTTGFVGTLIFTLFFALCSTEINTDFIQKIAQSWFSSFESFETILFFTIAIMGFGTTLVLTPSLMQLFKTSNNPKKQG